mgnify:CR=1 FL=1
MKKLIERLNEWTDRQDERLRVWLAALPERTKIIVVLVIFGVFAIWQVKLMFQPAEEIMDGANDMIAAGILENPHVDAAMAMHVLHDNLGKAGYTRCADRLRQRL